MRGNWNKKVRQVHTWLGVFFSPLLLLFAITGWWQTFATDETKNHGPINAFLSRLSDIHTSDYYAHAGGASEPSPYFQYLVAAMALALIASILMGLALAFQGAGRTWRVGLALLLGVLVPVLILYFH